jgi:hypothetical protein
VIKLFGPDRTRIGDEAQEWAVWVSGPDDIHTQHTLEAALITAAEFNATACETYDGNQFSPVIYAVVLHWGYAWARDVEHTTGGTCGVNGCAWCDAAAEREPELKPVSTDEWAEAVVSAGLTPGPSFACRLDGGPYEVGVHVAINDQLTDDTRHQLIKALQVAVGSTVRRVLRRKTAV